MLFWIVLICIVVSAMMTASVVQWSDFLAADPEGSGSIPGSATFSK
jgi:hypothetical protein